MSTLPAAPRTRAEQFQFLRDAHDGPNVWHGQCLRLTHEAPGIPAGVPTALAAAIMVPQADRVHQVHNFRRGMSLFYDDPADDNPFAHVGTVAGWFTKQPTGNLHDVALWSSDILRDGGVDLVRADLITTAWGDPYLYASRSLNGYALPGYHQDTTKPLTIGQNLDAAIDAVRRALRFHRAKGHPLRAAALAADLAELKQTRAKYPNP